MTLPEEPEYQYVMGVFTDDIGLVENAISKGVPVDAPLFGHGATALVVAVGKSEQMVRLLLNRGAPVNAEDWEGVTPLLNAVYNGRVSIVALLLEHGADPLHRTPWGAAREVAESEGSAEIVEMLLKAGG
ncbi:MAG: ankyrin repeat domain-containing protein [Armatimonadota bacterium]|nr:ankyrin repeat domain-containing protein [Armatimonadota bacterium]